MAYHRKLFQRHFFVMEMKSTFFRNSTISLRLPFYRVRVCSQRCAVQVGLSSANAFGLLTLFTYILFGIRSTLLYGRNAPAIVADFLLFCPCFSTHFLCI